MTARIVSTACNFVLVSAMTVFVGMGLASVAFGGDATPTDMFLGLTPDAAKGYEIMMHEPMATAIMKVADLDRLWIVWEEDEKAKAEKADSVERRRMTFMLWLGQASGRLRAQPAARLHRGRQGEPGHQLLLVPRRQGGGPDDSRSWQHPRRPDDAGHGRVATARLEGGNDPAQLAEAIAPFKTPLNYHKGVTNAVIFAPMFIALRDPVLAREFNKHPELLLHHDMNPPPWWNFKKKTRIYTDAFGPRRRGS